MEATAESTVEAARAASAVPTREACQAQGYPYGRPDTARFRADSTHRGLALDTGTGTKNKGRAEVTADGAGSAL